MNEMQKEVFIYRETPSYRIQIFAVNGHSQKRNSDYVAAMSCRWPQVAGRDHGGCNMTKVLPTAESDAGTAPRASSNIRHLCRMELAGGGQIVIDGNYAYVGHQHRPQGTTILDIADPGFGNSPHCMW